MFVRACCLLTTAICAGGLFASATACAADIKPAVIYDLGGKFDKSFNEGVFNGATKFSKETGVAFRDLAGKIASVDTLEGFMQDFRKRFAVAKATN